LLIAIVEKEFIEADLMGRELAAKGCDGGRR
jgi:hypothetical protein